MGEYINIYIYMCMCVCGCIFIFVCMCLCNYHLYSLFIMFITLTFFVITIKMYALCPTITWWQFPFCFLTCIGDDIFVNIVSNLILYQCLCVSSIRIVYTNTMSIINLVFFLIVLILHSITFFFFSPFFYFCFLYIFSFFAHLNVISFGPFQ